MIAEALASGGVKELEIVLNTRAALELYIQQNFGKPVVSAKGFRKANNIAWVYARVIIFCSNRFSSAWTCVRSKAAVSKYGVDSSRLLIWVIPNRRTLVGNPWYTLALLGNS